ncbi:MAG: arsenate reductase ArsC [Deltaproteobacteria bacterium]|nr:arsenate reductase ArsC [Deltaproteobacteria bacterium]
MKKILFVCVENSNRSQMAEAFAKIHGKGIVEAYSAGSKPSGKVNPKAIEAMREISYDLTTHESKSLDDISRERFEYVVSMGCGDNCPFVPAKNRINWDIPDPKHLDKDEFRKVRNLIEEKVKELLEKIIHSNISKPPHQKFWCGGKYAYRVSEQSRPRRDEGEE